MRGSKLAACRTKSLPTEGRSGIKSRKVKPRVSFSSLPPAKIEFEADNRIRPTDKNSVLCARIAQFNNEKTGERGLDKHDPPKQERNKRGKEFEKERQNDLDSVNEMLMDIIEEIEAENVTVEDCLRDAVMLNVLCIEEARQVIPEFVSEKKDIVWGDINNNSHFICKCVTSECGDGRNEKSIDKLLDVLSALKTDDLSKCCKYTLGKLCQLTSYEDYENIQKIAASSRCNSNNDDGARNTRTLSEDSFGTTEYPDDSSSTDNSCLSSSSSENLDISSLGSERECTSDSEQTYSAQRDIVRSIESRNNIQDVLTAFIDQGVLRPRQVWSIMESGNGEEMLKRVMEEISSSFGGEAMKNYTENAEKDFWIGKVGAQNRTCGVLDIDLGYCSNHSDSDAGQIIDASHTNDPTQKSRTKRTSLTNINVSRKFGKNIPSWSRPFTIAPARSKTRRVTPITSTPDKLPFSRINPSDSESTSDEDCRFLESWCQANDLPPYTSYVLRCKGCSEEDDVLALQSSDVHKLNELTWSVKGRLWTAIESLRLDKTYFEYRNKLNKCARTLQSLPS